MIQFDERIFQIGWFNHQLRKQLKLRFGDGAYHEFTHRDAGAPSSWVFMML